MRSSSWSGRRRTGLWAATAPCLPSAPWPVAPTPWLLSPGSGRCSKRCLRPTLERALPGLTEPLVAAGILVRSVDEVRAIIDIRPYASDEEEFWVASDLTPNLDTRVAPIAPDHVLGVSAASATLAELTVRRPVQRALDLGTGCGVQSLHLARHAGHVVATDLNPRACELARLTFGINATTVDLRLGDLYRPVAGEQFDLIVANPPYVISPPGPDPADLPGGECGRRHAGRTRGHRGRRVTWPRAACSRYWPTGPTYAARTGPTGWRAGSRATGCDAHVVQREVLDPYAYIEIWLADAGLAGSPSYPDRYRAWCDYFDRLRIEAVGLGWLVLRNAGRSHPWVRIEDWPHPLEQPIGPALAAELDAVDRLAEWGTTSFCRRDGGWPRTWSRRPPASPGRPTRSRSCFASSAVSDAH